MRSKIERFRFGNATGQLLEIVARFALDRRQVSQFSVNLVRRRENERRLVGRFADRLQQIERADGIDLEIVTRIGN